MPTSASLPRPPRPHLPLTIIIPTFNEQANLPAALDSASFADEILVVDSFSTDATPDLARAAVAADPSRVRLLQHEYVNSATQKNWAIPQAAHPWVMILDADERIPPDLREEILAFLATPDGPAATSAADGLRVFRLNHFMGKPIRHSGWQKDSVLRVFPRDRSRYLDRQVHADVIIFSTPADADAYTATSSADRTVPLPAAIESDLRRATAARVQVAHARMPHYTFTSFDAYMRKFDRYTTWAAGDRAPRTRRVGFNQLLGRPAFRFFRQYILDRGFLDGRAGFIVCALAAFSVFLKYAKLWERQQQPAPADPAPTSHNTSISPLPPVPDPALAAPPPPA